MPQVSELTTHLTGLTQEELCEVCPLLSGCPISVPIDTGKTPKSAPTKMVALGSLSMFMDNVEVLMPGVTYAGLYRARELAGPDMLRVSFTTMPTYLAARHDDPALLLDPEGAHLDKFALTREEVQDAMGAVPGMVNKLLKPELGAHSALILAGGGPDAEAIKMALAGLALGVFGGGGKVKEKMVISSSFHAFPPERLRKMTHVVAKHPATKVTHICVVDEWLGDAALLQGYCSEDERLSTFTSPVDLLLPCTQEDFDRLRGREFGMDDVTALVERML